MLEMNGMDHGLLTIVGQVIHCRALSKKLVFLDVRRTDEHDGPSHIELVVKLVRQAM